MNIVNILDCASKHVVALEAKLHELERQSRELDVTLARIKLQRAEDDGSYNEDETPIDHTELKFGREDLPRPGYVPCSPEFDEIFRSKDNDHEASQRITWEAIQNIPPEAIGFLFHNVMSKEEMQAVMSFCEDRTEMIPASTTQQYRNCDRVEVVSPLFSKFLWSRLQSTGHYLFSTAIDDAPKRYLDQPRMPGLEGTWEPYGLNALIRIIRYPYGGHFSPHYDGHYTFSSTDRTFLTCMMYLTDNFDKGQTEFLSAPIPLESGKAVLSPAVTSSIKPKAGTCIVFSPYLLHQGGFPVKRHDSNEMKWILRTEVCFKRTKAPERPAHIDRAIELLEKARFAEVNSRHDEAVEHYRAAFRLYPDLNQLIK